MYSSRVFDENMSYSQEISRITPAYIVILIDQSFSMDFPFGSYGSRAEECAKAVNRVLRELVLACTDGEDIKNSCDISVLGYGIDDRAVNAFSGKLANQSVVTIQNLTETCLRVEQVKRKIPDGAGGIIEIDDQFPVWVEPVAAGTTPMGEAFEQAYELVKAWIFKHSASFPPVIINITDGEATSMQRAQAAVKKLSQLATEDGQVLLLNAHISGGDDAELVLPASEDELPKRDMNAKFLFDISSTLPSVMLERASAAGMKPKPYSKGFVYKANLETMVQLLEIGTKADFMAMEEDALEPPATDDSPDASASDEAPAEVVSAASES